jgi:phage/plasmid-associated DNA primase
VQIWTGEGDNGKSITQMIFEQMLGPYNVKLPTSLITGKRT